jgi:elongation factor Ts
MTATVITANQVKELRQATGVGMMECKKALTESSGNMEKAIIWLREKGLSRAAAKSNRTAAEGVISIASNPEQTCAVMIELNCETDFSGKNEDFRMFSKDIAELALSKKIGDLDTLKSTKFKTSTVAEELTQLILKVGENMNLRRIVCVEEPEGMIATYSHMGGKIGALVMLNGVRSTDARELGMDLSMHVAASAPKYFKREDVPNSELELEKNLAKKRLLEQGKPEDMVEKITMGQLGKFYSEVCFFEQPFVKDPKIVVSKHVQQIAPKAELRGFHRFQLGEGIEIQKSDFAAEVAAQLKTQ